MEEQLRMQRIGFISVVLYVLILASIVILLRFMSDANAADVTLAWAPKKSPDIAGYRIYYGTCSGIYTSRVDAGKTTNIRISDLQKTHTYYFTATTYDHNGNESSFSEEFVYSPSVSDAQKGRIAQKVRINI